MIQYFQKNWITTKLEKVLWYYVSNLAYDVLLVSKVIFKKKNTLWYVIKFIWSIHGPSFKSIIKKFYITNINNTISLVSQCSFLIYNPCVSLGSIVSTKKKNKKITNMKRKRQNMMHLPNLVLIKKNILSFPF
jgi:hypothetical protein